MLLTLAAVGRLKSGPDRELFERYLSRTRASGRSIGVRDVGLIEIPESRAGDPNTRMTQEAEGLLDKLYGKARGAAAPSDRCLVCLDERGASMTSADFAAFLGSHMDRGTPRLDFAIGGADGHGPSIQKIARHTLRLSDMTLPHGLARIVLAEQLYRAITIITGHPYHRA